MGELKIKGGEKLGKKQKEDLLEYFKEKVGIKEGVIIIKEVQ